MATGDAGYMYNFPQWHPLSHQSPLPNCHRVRINGKKYRKRRKKACYCYTSELGNKTTCNAIVGLSLFLILVVVVSIAALAIYIGMEVILDGSLKVTYGDYYTAELYNKTSHFFLAKAHTYKVMIESVFAKSILGPAVKQCIIMGFKNGSLVVFYRLILDRRKIPARIFANLEETAKKILFEEITSLKPVVFNGLRLDPKHIILKKHLSNLDAQIENPSDSSSEDATVTSINPNGVLKRVTHTTPTIVRKRPGTSSISSVNASLVRSKNMKKSKPTIEKTSRLKLQLDSNKLTAKVETTTKSKKNVDINGNLNRYSFVSDDQKGTKNFSVSENSSVLLGEAEVIIIPSTAEGDHAERSDGVTSQRPKTYKNRNMEEDRSLLRDNGKVHKLDEPDERKITREIDSPINDRITTSITDNATNFSVNVPMRSNIALNKPRPKPVAQKNDNTTIVMTNEKETKKELVGENTEIGQTTEDSVIVLNTEVVTSTSMRVSYSNDIVLEEVINDSNFEESDNITHIVPSLYELTGAKSHTKYKNIFPRSIKNDERTNETNRSKINTHLNLIIEKYRKQPSNETLQMIIEQLATLYTKVTTTPIFHTAKLNFSKPSYNGMLLTKPANKVFNITTSASTTPASKLACEGNSTKRCKNGQCISEHLWCNQFADCADGSDEKNCTCADYLIAQFSYKKICDGMVDCWDFSDEYLCEWCSPEKYVCENAKLCINQNKLCDGNHDCPLGDDEKNCITIAPFSQKNNDITYYSEGIIAVRRAGLWGKLCHNNLDENKTNEEAINRLSELGKAVCKIMTFKNFDNIKIIKDAEPENFDNSSIYYRLTNVEKNNTNSFRRKNFKFTKTNCSSKQVVQITCSELKCGIQTQIGKSRVRGKYRGERRSRIVGGGSAALGAWPWQAALYKEGEFQCGATLISSKWLLSAGHCFNNALHDYWVARMGILRRSSTLPSPHEQIRPIRRIIIHPNYTDAGFINDISLLEMSTEVQFTNFVRPICLPNPNRFLLDGTLCTVIGWGQLMESGSIYPDTLQEVQLPVISPGECHKRTAFLPLYKITDGMLCAGFDRGGRDACLGDSGGPLMCQDNGDTWHLYGVTSNGNGCARAHRPGVYTKVANYMNWIDNNLKNTTGRLNSPKTQICNGHRCPLGECLPKARVCNGYMECSNGSDEFNCH